MAKFKIGDKVWWLHKNNDCARCITGVLVTKDKIGYFLYDLNIQCETIQNCVYWEEELQLYSEYLKEKDAIWKPKNEEREYFIDANGDIDYDSYSCTANIDAEYLQFGNVFQTEQEAQEISDALRIILNSKSKRLKLIELSKDDKN